MLPKGVIGIINNYLEYKHPYFGEILHKTIEIRGLLDYKNIYWKRGDVTRIMYSDGWGIVEKNPYYWAHREKRYILIPEKGEE